ncbi:TonB-dependent receptor [Hyphomicrobium sp.]|uniref:TonB-dependent receptor family protein n=1 Tax=Hyphomicrobium sp. TaxID=82 RepID=UPI0025C55C47|nr:TonB-dependent receptor [Hyphomicrobium sp.]
MAQEPPTPAPPADQLPPVDVIQKQPTPAPAAKKKSAAKKKQVSPTPQPPAAVAAPAPTGITRDAGGRPVTSAAPVTSPVTPESILPSNLEGFSSAASRVTKAQLDEQRPADTHEAFKRVPGVVVTNDDGFARHIGIGMRGSPFRRGRKVLILEDGQSINMSSYIDPSTHYTPPLDRVESIEVLRGTVISHGPLNNHGVVNFQNLNPFGPEETVISAAIGTTEHSLKDWNNTRHFHTRQHAGNVGAVFSYSGAEAAGAWDNEVLRYNDFYGALGWKGVDQDLVVSAVYYRQRDNYDEANLEMEDDALDDLGFDSADEFFYGLNHCRTCYNPGSSFNTYSADVVVLQAAHNYYLDADTTISSRLYGFYHKRDRYENDFEFEDGNSIPGPVPPDDEFVMEGRRRTYTKWGAEVRGEWANRPFIAGLKQDIQAGIRYEHQTFDNRNFEGEEGVIYGWGDESGEETILDERYRSDSVAAFLQTAIHVTKDFSVIPGVRFETYDVERVTYVNEDRVDSGELDPGDFPLREYVDHALVLPGIAFSYDGFYRTTLYGGYHRGHTPHVARGEFFPLPAETGDNFQVGLRTTAFKGLTFEGALFHSRIDNYQIKEAFTTATGNNIFGNIEEVEINGFELYSRLDSQPYTGGKFNLFGEATYTFADSIIEKGVEVDEDTGDITVVNGNELPEVPRHFANLTVGIEERGLWDASVTWSYRGDFYTDVSNTPLDEEGEVGLVPDVWLLSARANYHIPGTGATVFISGHNLTDEYYITDREDGVKPGIGRTYWAGFKYKLQ